MSAAPKRVAISLAPGERDALEQLARKRGEPVATTAARLVRAALADHGAALDQPPARRAGPSRPHGQRHPRTLASADPIEALRARYPQDLRHVPADLDADTLVAEQLAALATWRAQLDATPDPHPRDVLGFGYELRTTAAWLQERARRSR